MYVVPGGLGLTNELLSALDESPGLLAKPVLQVDEPTGARLDLARGRRLLQPGQCCQVGPYLHHQLAVGSI